MSSLSLRAPIEEIPFISAAWRRKLSILGIKTVEDLLYHFPFRYEDFSQFKKISALGIGEVVTIRGVVEELKTKQARNRRMSISEMYIKDETGTIKAVWFNLAGPLKYASRGRFIQISGKTSLSKTNELQFQHPNFELLSKENALSLKNSQTNSFSTGSLIAIYPETKGLTSFWLRKTIKQLLELVQLEEFLPEKILGEADLPLLEDALWGIHFPESIEETAEAKRRFAFEKMLLFQLKALSIKAAWDKNKAPKIKFNQKLIRNFVASLPFSLTDAQKKSAWQIIRDLEKNIPMNRLLEGDVGSGKTVVAAMAILATISNRFQAAFLAPTEILAIQHYEGIANLFEKLPYKSALLTGTKAQIGKESVDKKELKKELSEGKIDFVVGTHALLQDTIAFKKLGLVSIDEQHRFGVKQRAYLQQETLGVKDGVASKIPHLLTMTATPIPRTLSLALFGNLDLSIINEYPKGRKKIITKVVSAKNREQVYLFIKQEIKKGRQIFLIYPLVEESSKISQVKAATEEIEKLQKGAFSQFKLKLLHGKMKAKEKEAVMASFKKKKFDILVATSVVEVGIDIPNASVMVIEGAERFGLAQLHQFRGRVGRGEHQSYCFLITSDTAPDSTRRLAVLEKTNDGFVIAQEDMKLRGPGQFMGLAQSGVPDIAMESLTDVNLIQLARTNAQELLTSDASLRALPLLKEKLDKLNSQVHWE